MTNSIRYWPRYLFPYLMSAVILFSLFCFLCFLWTLCFSFHSAVPRRWLSLSLSYCSAPNSYSVDGQDINVIWLKSGLVPRSPDFCRTLIFDFYFIPSFWNSNLGPLFTQITEGRDCIYLTWTWNIKIVCHLCIIHTNAAPLLAAPYSYWSTLNSISLV